MKYLLDLQTFVVDKLPDDGTLVPKHVRAGIRYEVCFNQCNLLVSKHIKLVCLPLKGLHSRPDITDTESRIPKL